MQEKRKDRAAKTMQEEKNKDRRAEAIERVVGPVYRIIYIT
jgi:hypothetical protein